MASLPHFPEDTPPHNDQESALAMKHCVLQGPHDAKRAAAVRSHGPAAAIPGAPADGPPVPGALRRGGCSHRLLPADIARVPEGQHTGE